MSSTLLCSEGFAIENGVGERRESLLSYPCINLETGTESCYTKDEPKSSQEGLRGGKSSPATPPIDLGICSSTSNIISAIVVDESSATSRLTET